jgi:hypothetical protein
MPAGGGPPHLLRRHNEVRSALTFVLNTWYKHKQAGTSPDATASIAEFARFRSLDAVLRRVRGTPGGAEGRSASQR